MTEARKAATRPVGNARIFPDGSIVAESMLSPESFVVGAEVWIPPRKVIPIVFLPGIMGSNLKVIPGREETVRNRMGVPKGSTIPVPWRPPNDYVEGSKEVIKWGKQSPKVRQALLSGDTTVVDDSGFLATQVEGMPLSNLTSLNDEEARFRGWGTVHWDSYGEYLLYLERELRNLQDSRLFLNPQMPIAGLDDPLVHAAAEWWPLLHAGDPKQSDAPAAFKVTKDDLKKLSKRWFPVYACGYNWINSCAASGQQVLDTIEKIIQVYTKIKGPSGKQLFECEKVILVTHSMGGLVGRWAAKHDDNQRILGVVHGVQPAVGAPLAYRRAVAGTEPGGFTQNQFAKIIGRTQAETTPVVCNSAGSLQLLPTKLYPKGWLKLERDESTSVERKTIRTMESLPKSDPYEEIYRQKHAWWRLADPKLLDPAKRFKGTGQDPWTNGYLTFLEKAESFHDGLGDYYHPNTYVCYGDDPDHLSFGSVRWRVELPSLRTIRMADNEIIASQQPTTEAPPELLPEHNMNIESYKNEFTESLLKGRRLLSVFPTEIERFNWSGNREVVPLKAESGDGRKVKADYMIANIQPADVPGDGTVPWQSGEAPGKAGPKERTFALRGYDHQGCYNDDGPRRFSLWAIARMVRETV